MDGPQNVLQNHQGQGGFLVGIFTSTKLDQREQKIKKHIYREPGQL
jgi:hypothetical protein